MYNPNSKESLEKYSSAITLSDMEIFIFPEIMYALTLANIMSPLLWQWKQDSWFDKLDKLNEYRRILRLKQYILDHFTFNLDLDTWGLTTKQKELARFTSFIDEKTLSQSNALFGYEGDKYYFDIDIRRHFGLDKYTTDIIPYWKTETAEAMVAFKHKPKYLTGAGECVSLAALYASALFAVAGVSLRNIFMVATPLHSQNFIDCKDGILTNNRRIVTKNMWFNGTELSVKAQRALRHERATMVVNSTGYVHTLYPEATMNPDDYKRFEEKLGTFLKTDITFEILANFLREHSSLQKCFQFTHSCCGKPRYIEAEKVYTYEHSSRSRVSDDSRATLLHEIDEDEFYPTPIENRMLIDELETYFKKRPVSIDTNADLDDLKRQLCHKCFNVDNVITQLVEFCRITPRLPESSTRSFVPSQPIEIDSCKNNLEVIEKLKEIRTSHPIADLAFMAYRDMRIAPWKPFMKAAVERNPVCVSATEHADPNTIANRLNALENGSIYDGTRVAQPDEIWNFGRGDGLEKAVCLYSILVNKYPQDSIIIEGDAYKTVVRGLSKEWAFGTEKRLEPPTPQDCILT